MEESSISGEENSNTDNFKQEDNDEKPKTGVNNLDMETDEVGKEIKQVLKWNKDGDARVSTRSNNEQEDDDSAWLD